MANVALVEPGLCSSEMTAITIPSVSRELPECPSPHRRHVVMPPRWMLNPESSFKIKWDVVLALCVFYTSCVVPVRISFGIDATGFFYVFECGLDFCFFVDILFSFRTGLVDPTTGHVYYNQRQIVQTYLRGWFAIDLVSTVPLEFMAKHLYPDVASNTLQSAKILRGLKLIRLLKLVRIRKIGQMISKLEGEVFANQSVLALVKILLFMLFLAHLVACVWFYVAQLSPYSWSKSMGFMANDHANVVSLQYLSSLYWAIVTMTTVGYGDITPKTKTELIIAMFVMIIGVSMFGYVIGNITSLVDNINAAGRMQSQHITTLKEYVIVRNLPKHLGKRVLDHFEYYYRHRSVFDEDAILKNLPTGMRNDVVHHVLQKTIARIDLLSSGHHEGLVSDLAVAMQPFFCVQDDEVYAEQDIAVHVFFLLKGTVRLVNTKWKPKPGVSRSIVTIEEGGHFGQVELFHPRYSRGMRLASAVAKTYCQLTMLSRPSIESIGKTWPELIARFVVEATVQAKLMEPILSAAADKSFEVHSDLKPSPAAARSITLPPMALSPADEILPAGATSSNSDGQQQLVKDANTCIAFSTVAPLSAPVEKPCRGTAQGNDSHVPVVAGSHRLHLPEKKVAHFHWMLHPHDIFVVNWQMTVATAIVYSSFMVPYRIAFEAEPVAEGRYLDTFVDVLFGLDIAIMFRLAYHNADRQLVCNAGTIAKKYIKGWFVIDLFSTLPFDTIGAMFVAPGSAAQVAESTKYLRMFRVARLFKLVRLLKIGKVFKRIRDSIQLSPSTERLLKLVTIMICFGHWCACIFHWIMLFEEESGGHTWCTDYFFPYDDDPGACSDRVPNEDRYVVAIYWAFTTMTTVGYGDLHPSKFSVPELSFAVVCLIVNSTVFAYVVSGIIGVISNHNPSEREYRTQMNEMKDYVRDTAMSVRLSSNVKRHYDFLLSTTCLFPEEQIFNQLRPSLRFDVARLVASNTIMTINIIATMEKKYKGFVSYALFLLRPQFILRSERVCRSGSPGTEMFFLVEGECEQMDQDNHNVRVLGEGTLFEAYALLAPPEEHYRMQSTVTALTPTCQLYSLSVQEFESIADLSPAISVNLGYELAMSVKKDDFLRLSADQVQKTVLPVLHLLNLL
ncbi:hypothetical protein H310_10202 [Aphanomyces invadans]|uniref:Cyclic nucleotide-binding domain-containing protein n=1 Tax=Aphanomyces invadans TaxID=157072 RepID=A0A024TR43_9STRA|nr:hypothetical protein H310_10202 [Aphanomyces invadans]ETV96449.1 hypothetical protein H310_10202 [Aphanomyces invadans]|eukprot:XP_008874712.1 hypothetical protein H310_10202 [Aphanomyces invadans]